MRLTEDLCVKYGIDTYFTSISTPIPVANQREINIAKTLPKQLGLIYGLSIYADTVDPANNDLITSAQASLLYFFLKDGPTEFLQLMRLDEMIFTFAGFPNTNNNRYLPVNILGTFDLSTSSYINPTGIVSAAPPEVPTVIRLNMWFISTESTAYLMSKGVIEGDPVAFKNLKAK